MILQENPCFIEVILPLHLPNTYTYRLKREEEKWIQIGQRVIVSFGKNKLYAALVIAIHQEIPDYSTKYIETILDDRPIVLSDQLELWKWMAEYYCCTIGEVMLAALPAGLKLKSEAKIIIHPDFQGQENTLFEGIKDTCSNRELQILTALQEKKTLSLIEISQILNIKTVQPIIKKMLEKKMIILNEEVQEKFKPKKSVFISLNPNYSESVELEKLFQSLTKSQKQLQALMAYIQLKNKTQNNWVKKTDLEKETQIPAYVFKELEKKNILFFEEQIVSRLKNHLVFASSHFLPTLSQAQKKALSDIQFGWADSKKNITLLQGVTGSGKTEIYFYLIKDALDQKKKVLYLVPEIALTIQLVTRLQKYFGTTVGVYHSKFSMNERTEIWSNLIQNDEQSYNIIIGARTSVFLPFQNLGLIIVDEEHERTFKQNSAPHYQARDVALMLAKKQNAKILLSSATPSLESYANAKIGKYNWVHLTERFGGAQLPMIELIDRKQEDPMRRKEIFSPQLLIEIQKTLEKKEQIILFQNRKGYTPILYCIDCGWKAACPKCDVSLSYYKSLDKLKCNYCAYTTPLYQQCKSCHSHRLEPLGLGTEKIEETIQKHFPNYIVQRMDLETTRKKNDYWNIIEQFEERKIDILVGTQMLSKGLDFEYVGLVGILDADSLLHYPNFRAHEQAIQLLLQVSGRTGRRKNAGKVLVQSNNTLHPILQYLKNYALSDFYTEELKERIDFNYPPYTRLIEIQIKHKDPYIAELNSACLVTLIKQKLEPKIYILGPSYGAIERIDRFYIQHIFLKIPKNLILKEIKQKLQLSLQQIYQTIDSFKTCQVVIDVDPM